MAISQVVILAAGQSSRFYPFADSGHKCETVLLGKPIIAWTLESLKNLHVTSVIVVISHNNPSLQAWVQQASFPFQIITVIQPESTGMADAILSARSHLEDHFVVINANHINAGETITRLEATPSDVVGLCCQPTDRPQCYGILTLHNGLAIGLVEKPVHPIEHPHKVIGVYHLTRDFTAFMASLPAEEYRLETALNLWMHTHTVPVVTLDPTATLTLKYPWDLFTLKDYLLAHLQPSISPTALIAPTAIIKGSVIIEDEAVVGDFATIEGPAYVGHKAVVGQYCLLRKASSLEAGAQIQRYGDIANSILLEGAHIHSGFIGDSIIGAQARIGAGFITANRRFDRQEVAVRVKNQKIATGRTALGAFIGSHATIGIQAGTMPGVVIGNNCCVSPGIIVKHNLPADASLS